MLRWRESDSAELVIRPTASAIDSAGGRTHGRSSPALGLRSRVPRAVLAPETGLGAFIRRAGAQRHGGLPARRLLAPQPLADAANGRGSRPCRKNWTVQSRDRIARLSYLCCRLPHCRRHEYLCTVCTTHWDPSAFSIFKFGKIQRISAILSIWSCFFDIITVPLIICNLLDYPSWILQCH